MELSQDKWRYFGRGVGGLGVFEIYRIPNNGLSFAEQDRRKFPERLMPDGRWKCFKNDRTLWNERLVGDFNERTDEITPDVVQELFALWKQTEWPGRTGLTYY